MSKREVLKYYTRISEVYDKIRFNTKKAKIISFLQIEWFIKNLGKRSICLEIGCGTGRITRYLIKNSNFLVATDVSNEMIKINKQKAIDSVNYIVCDASYLPFRENIFDGVIAARVFWHLPDYVRALRESFRVVKKGGVMLFDFPCLMGPFSIYSKMRKIKHDVLTLFIDRKGIKEIFRNAKAIIFSYNTSILLFFAPNKILLHQKLSKFIQLFERLNLRRFNDYLFSYYLIKLVK